MKGTGSGNNDKSKANLKKGKKFTPDYQPTPEAKSNGKMKLKTIQEGLEFIGSTVKATLKLTDAEGNEQVVELSHEARIAQKLVEMACNGNIKAIEQICKIKGLYAPTKNENTNFGNVEVNIVGQKNEDQFTPDSL